MFYSSRQCEATSKYDKKLDSNKILNLAVNQTQGKHK